MITLIAFIILMVGALNWFSIGLLQFDFVAGLFGSQSSIFSRLIYFIVGLSALVVLYNLISNRGRIVFDFKNRKETTNDLMIETKANMAEAGKELAPETDPKFVDDHEDDDFCADCKTDTQADHFEKTNSNPMPKPSNLNKSKNTTAHKPKPPTNTDKK